MSGVLDPSADHHPKQNNQKPKVHNNNPSPSSSPLVKPELHQQHFVGFGCATVAQQQNSIIGSSNQRFGTTVETPPAAVATSAVPRREVDSEGDDGTHEKVLGSKSTASVLKLRHLKQSHFLDRVESENHNNTNYQACFDRIVPPSSGNSEIKGIETETTSYLLPTTSCSIAASPTNHLVKEELIEAASNSDQQSGGFAVPAVPARIRSGSAVVARATEVEEEEEEKASTSVFDELKEEQREEEEAQLAAKQKIEQQIGDPEPEEEPQPSTSNAVAATANPQTPLRFAVRISAESALKLRRVARYHAHALRRLGVTTLQLDKLHLSNSLIVSGAATSSSNSVVHIAPRTPSPEVAQRKARQQLICQKHQFLHQRVQQQLAVAAQQFRVQQSPNPAAAFSQGKALAQNRSRVAPPVTAPVRPSLPQSAMHPSMIRQQSDPAVVPSQNAAASAGFAEKSPLLVNLLSNAGTPSQQHPAGFTQNPELMVRQNMLSHQQMPTQQAMIQQQQHTYQQQQAALMYGGGCATTSPPTQNVAGQMHHPGFGHHPQQQQMPIMMMHPSQMGGRQMNYGPGGMVAAGGPHGPMMQMPPGTAMPIPYGMVPQQQQQHPQIGPSSVNAVTTPVKAQEEEPPKKRKRISKKQQQKEEREQQLRLQQEQQAMALQMQRHQQHQQQMYMIQQQQQKMAALQQQQQGMSYGIQQQQQYPQQNMVQQHQFASQQPVPNALHSPPLVNHHHFGNQQQQNNTSPSHLAQHPQQYPGMHPGHGPYMSPGMWRPMGIQNRPTQQNQMFDYPHPQHMATGQSVHHQMPQPQQLQQQSARTPGGGNSGGASFGYGHSPMAVGGGSSTTPFHSPPPQQGTPGSVMHPASVGPPPTPYPAAVQHRSQQGTPVGSGGATTAEPSRTNTPQQPHSVPQLQQHFLQPQTPVAGQPQQQQQQAVQEYGGAVQRQQQQQQQHPIASMSAINKQQFHPHQQQQQPSNVFPSQLSDFAERDLVDDIVPSISNEADDFDLDSIEPMRCGGEHHPHQQQQQQRVHQQNVAYPHHHQHHQQMQQQLIQNQMQGTPSTPSQQQQQQQHLNFLRQQQQESLNQMHQQQHQKAEMEKEKHSSSTMSSIDDRHAEMELMLPDRSPQLGDTPLSPSKLSEAQDRNVTDAISSVMERVARSSGPPGKSGGANGGGKSGKSKGPSSSKRGSVNSNNGNEVVQAPQKHQISSSSSRTPTPQTPSSSCGAEQQQQQQLSKGMTTMTERKKSLELSGPYASSPSQRRQHQQYYYPGPDQRYAGLTRPFSYPPPSGIIENGGEGMVVVQHSQQVQQALADSSTSASTTPTTASSSGGGGAGSMFAMQFNGHFHAAQHQHYALSSSSASPPTDRKTPLSAPVGKVNEALRFDNTSSYCMDPAAAYSNQQTSLKQHQRKRKAENVADGGDGDGDQQQQPQQRPRKKAVTAAPKSSSTTTTTTQLG